MLSYLPQIKHAASGKCLQLNRTQIHIWDCVENDPAQLFGFLVLNEGHRIVVQADLRLMCVDQDGRGPDGNFERDDCTDASDRKFMLIQLGESKLMMWKWCLFATASLLSRAHGT